jgi:META domain
VVPGGNRGKWTITGVPPARERYIKFDGGTSPATSGGLNGSHIGGRAYGSGGINSFNAEFEGDAGFLPNGGRLEMKKWVSTRIMSDQLETKFFNILTEADQYMGDDNGLRIIENSGAVLHFEPCDLIWIDDPITADFNQDFKLRVNQFAQLRDGTQDIHVKFDGAYNDSRCPLGVQCAWEGDATVSVTLTIGNTAYTGELHTNASVGPTVMTLGSYDIKLVDLLPYPLPNQVIMPDEYTAVFRVTKH